MQGSLSVPTYPPPKNFIGDLHESQNPSFLKKTVEFPRIRGESSCLINVNIIIIIIIDHY